MNSRKSEKIQELEKEAEGLRKHVENAHMETERVTHRAKVN